MTEFGGPRNGRIWLRAGLLTFAVIQGVPAVWAACWPNSFYTGFPTTGRAWLTLFPPYNDHLVRDFGLMALQLTAMFVYSAITLEFRLVRAILLAALLFYVPHLVYHQSHVVLGTDTLVQLASQVVPVVLLVALLVVNHRSARRTRRPSRPR
ncbi:hypothetical protein [Actinophytocola gossypii]|uniref:Uncharacterized protein n=1 Tax=Actinophytocola gossypii TaxID=2812003 RepID=A0ABT2J2Q7_9PSEU|nr:hypothetical protein [Actinophytocola gossypii]MCT2582147.1 hypothetical protein [Actinophytocola gossypii]